MDEGKRGENGQNHLSRNPMTDFTDAVNRSMVGDPGALAKGSCLTKILNLFMLIVLILVFAQCSK